MSDVMFYEVFEEEKAAIIKHLPGTIDAKFAKETIQELGEAPPSPFISIRTQSVIPGGWAGDLKAVLTRSQGYDHIVEFHQQNKTKIAYGYLGDYCSRAVAEQAILMMMALLRKLKKQTRNFTAFSRDGLTGHGCAGRKTLVAGVGHIGREIVALAKALGMQVRGFDIEKKIDDLDYVPLDEGLKWAEIVHCALPLTDVTRGMLDYGTFQKGGPYLVFINIARGEISPVGDLKRLLDEGIVGSVGLDVYQDEPALAYEMRAGARREPAGGRNALIELSEHDSVLFTPHNAFNTEDALKRKVQLSVEAVISYLKDGTFPQAVPVA